MRSPGTGTSAALAIAAPKRVVSPSAGASWSAASMPASSRRVSSSMSSAASQAARSAGSSASASSNSASRRFQRSETALIALPPPLLRRGGLGWGGRCSQRPLPDPPLRSRGGGRAASLGEALADPCVSEAQVAVDGRERDVERLRDLVVVEPDEVGQLDHVGLARIVGAQRDERLVQRLGITGRLARLAFRGAERDAQLAAAVLD